MEKSTSVPEPGGHVCPWWLAYTFDNTLRRLAHDPEKLLSPYVRSGMTVLDVGCGMGHFSIGMARLVGPSGKVHSVDLQEKMLRVLTGRARRLGLLERIRPALCTAGSLGIENAFDFVLAFWMVHEVPDPESLFREIADRMKPGAFLLYAEPSFHVKEALFHEIRRLAVAAGLHLEGAPRIRFSRSALLKKADSAA